MGISQNRKFKWGTILAIVFIYGYLMEASLLPKRV
jgi:hypothetical protein